MQSIHSSETSSSFLVVIFKKTSNLYYSFEPYDNLREYNIKYITKSIYSEYRLYFIS